MAGFTNSSFDEAYEFHCPETIDSSTCDALLGVGFLGRGVWLEPKCHRCKQFYHFGTVLSLFRVQEIRCPACERLRFRGLIAPNGPDAIWTSQQWFETKCARSRCREYFHLGAYGRGAQAIILELQLDQPIVLQGRQANICRPGQFIQLLESGFYACSSPMA